MPIICPLDIPCIIKNHMTIDPGYRSAVHTLDTLSTPASL